MGILASVLALIPAPLGREDGEGQALAAVVAALEHFPSRDGYIGGGRGDSLIPSSSPFCPVG